LPLNNPFLFPPFSFFAWNISPICRQSSGVADTKGMLLSMSLFSFFPLFYTLSVYFSLSINTLLYSL
jgi:hypothetical protein